MNQENNDSKICLICGRPTHKESKYCIFHASAEEKNEEDFKRELKKYINKIKNEDGDFDFKEFVFIGDINFIVEFNLAKFKNAIFEGVTFKGDVKFEKSIFEGITYFAKATFEGYADFGEATFEGYTNFCETMFKDFAQFREAKFKDNAIFEDAIFKEKSYFYGATFKNVNFRKVSFKNNAEFGSTNIIGYADYKDSYFKQNVNFGGGFSIYKYLIFNNAFFYPGKTLSIKIYNGHVKIYFKETILENIFLNLKIGKNVLVYLEKVLLRNTTVSKDYLEGRILQEKEGNFSDAKDIYIILKNNFNTIGRYDYAGWAFLKEKEMERKSYSYEAIKRRYLMEYGLTEDSFKKNHYSIGLFLKWLFSKKFRKWCISGFLDFLYGYGEKPFNIIISTLIIIFIFSLLFRFFGITTSPEYLENNFNLFKEISSTSEDINLSLKFKGTVFHNFWDCLYFSVTTFTTLGYGDFRPLEGLSRIFSGTEAFIGAFMMALFVYTFARRTGGR